MKSLRSKMLKQNLADLGTENIALGIYGFVCELVY